MIKKIKKVKAVRFLFFILVAGWGMWSCEKSNSYSEIPEICFMKLEVTTEGKDILGNPLKHKPTLTFSFADGDGNIGSFSNNGPSCIFYTWYKKMPNGEYEQYMFADTTFTQKTIIPYKDVMNREDAQNKLLKGEIKAILSAPSVPPAGMDTVRIEFYITDRTSNKSNVEYTPDFSILDEFVEIVQ